MKKWFYRFRSSDFYVNIQLKLEDFINYLKELDTSKIGAFFNSFMLVISPFFIKFDRFLKKSKYIKAFNYTTYQKEIEKDIKDTDEYTEKRMNGVYEHLKYTKIALVVIPILSFIIRLGGQGAASLSFKVLMLEIVAFIYLYYLKRKIDKYEFGEIILEEYLNTLFNYLSLRMDLKSAINVVSEFKNSIDRLEKEKKDKDFVLSEIDKTNLLITEDKQLGTIITLNTIEHSKEVKNSNNSNLAKYSILAQLDDNTEKAYYIKDNQIKIMLDDFMLKVADSYREYHEIIQMKDYYENLDNAYYFEDLFEIRERTDFVEKFESKFNKTNALKLYGIIKYIRENKDNLNFNVWDNFNKGIKGNEYYFSINCQILKNTPFAIIEKLKGTLETKFRKTVMFKQTTDKGSFELIIIVKEEIDSYTMTVNDLKKYNENNQIFLGKSWTGNLYSEWNLQANHTVFTGKSGSGKSVQIRNFITQLQQLRDFDYSEMYLMSSSKIADFNEFKEMGALTVGVTHEDFKGLTIADRIELTLQYIETKLLSREALFSQKGVESIKEYNKKNVDNPLNYIVLLIDEYENLLKGSDKKQVTRISDLTISILNIARSSGCIVLLGAQSILKSDIGATVDKMTVKFSGSNESNILNQVDSSVASYYKSLSKKPQGVFMLKADNLEINENIKMGDSAFTLVQTPYISDISTKNLKKLSGANNLNEILAQHELYAVDVEEDTQEKVIKLDTESKNNDSSDDDDIFSNLI